MSEVSKLEHFWWPEVAWPPPEPDVCLVITMLGGGCFCPELLTEDEDSLLFSAGSRLLFLLGLLACSIELLLFSAQGQDDY